MKPIWHSKMRPIWVLQTNLGSGMEDFATAITRAGMEVVPARIIPFSDELPKVDAGNHVLAFGSTGLVRRVHDAAVWTPGVFYNEGFDYRDAIEFYGDMMLNDEVEFADVDALRLLKNEDDDLIFVRPVSFLKSFSGRVMTAKEIRAWADMAKDGNLPEVTPATPVVLAKPWYINREWRLFMTNSSSGWRVAAGSQYKERGELCPSSFVPEEVKQYGLQALRYYAPEDALTIDIGESSGRLYIIEVQCINCSGFYKANLDDLVEGIEEATNHYMKFLPRAP